MQALVAVVLFIGWAANGARLPQLYKTDVRVVRNKVTYVEAVELKQSVIECEETLVSAGYFH